ncbi:MAG: hypothetical protein ACK4UX_10405 [Thiobacillus sp.]
MSPLSDLVSKLAHLSPFGKSADDPLVSLKAANRWLENLPLADTLKSQQAIHEQLKRFEGGAEQFTRERLAIFMCLDEKTRDLQDTLTHQYLRNPRMSRQVESQLWHAIYGFYWDLARGYSAFALALAREPRKPPQDTVLPVVTLRAMRAFGQLLKWRAIRYLPVTDKLWQRLHKFYRSAEEGGFHRAPLRAYPDDPTDCTCETAYLHILMLNLANSGSLYPRQIDQIDRWLMGWHGRLALSTTFQSDVHAFVVDLSADHGPRRVRKTESDKPLRFWSTATLLAKLEETRERLRAGTDLDPDDLPAIPRTADNIELLEYLQHQWDSLEKREQRRAPRAAVKLLIDVTHGLTAIVQQIKAVNTPPEASPYGIGLDSRQADEVLIYGFVTDRTRGHPSTHRAPSGGHADVERWVMEDESKFGFGATVESRDRDWLRVGALIGLRVQETEEWRLGVIRRLTRVTDDTTRIGIEALAETPTLAMLYDTTTPSYTVNGIDNSGATLPHASLWLAGEPASVIIDPVLYAPGKVFEVRGLAEHRHLALAQPLEHCEGWMRVRVEPVKR